MKLKNYFQRLQTWLSNAYDRLMLRLVLDGFVKQITVPAIRAGQRQTQLKLTHSAFFLDGAKAACPIGILTAAKRHQVMPNVKIFHSAGVAADYLPLSWPYLLGFTTGFDHGEGWCSPSKQFPASIDKSQEADFVKGFKDGKNARISLL